MKSRQFLTAEWRYLTMINYEIDSAILERYTPNGVELDAWNGKTFVSVVGFLFLNTRVLGLPIPFHRNFEEVNLRFYVRRKADDGWRRGVVFIKEIVPRWAIAAIARWVYNENYESWSMRSTVDPGSGVVEYGWSGRGMDNSLKARIEGVATPIADDSEEEFITEHYWGYAAQRDGGCMEYGVEHPRWKVWKARSAELACDVERVYGAQFADFLRAEPSSAFVADGSPVVVRRGVRI